jgi:cytoskeleton protein RodZ
MDQHLETFVMQSEAESPIAGTARIGMELRQVRERLGWQLPDLAATLRIRLPYLESIERGDLSALPGVAYQTGFVRTYAQALGLDGDEILRRFRAEGSNFSAKAHLSFLAPIPDRAVPTGAIVLLSVLVVLAGYGLWYRHTSEQAKLAAAVPSVPAELAPLAMPPKPPAVAAAAAIAPAAATPNAANSAPAAAPGTTATILGATPTPPAAAPSAANLTIQASADDWVEVQDAKGTIIFSKLLHVGDSWPVPDLPGLVMTVGNAGATTISNNGKASAPLGASGVPLHNYQLTPAIAAGTSTTVPPKTN